MKRISIHHETRYSFNTAVNLGPHKLMTRPREGHDIRIVTSTLSVTPNANLRWHRDVLGNSVAIARFTEPTGQLEIISQVTLDHYEEWPLDFLVEDYAVHYPFDYAEEELLSLAPYLNHQPDPDLTAWLMQFSRRDVESYVLLSNISQTIGETLQYTVREEPGVQSVRETLTLASGSCRDFAWLLMCAARELGFAARFVSGYLHVPVSQPPEGATHAWAEIYLPGAGWKGFDPTARKLAGTEHIPTAVALDPVQAPPVSGSFTGPTGTSADMSVRVTVSDTSSS